MWLWCCGQNMREGVIRDIERQEMKKQQNIRMLQDQIELTKRLRALQQQQSETDVARTNGHLTDTK